MAKNRLSKIRAVRIDHDTFAALVARAREMGLPTNTLIRRILRSAARSEPLEQAFAPRGGPAGGAN